MEFDIEEDGVDMCESLKKKELRDRVTAVIEAYRADGKTDEDIITRVLKLYDVTRDYVLALLTPQKA